MNWLKKKIIKWANTDKQEAWAIGTVTSTREVSNTVDDEPILNFRVFHAVNGQILEFRRYDRKSDRNYTSTYIVEKGKDMGEYINKCLSLELMK
jgi:hypothetical protein